MALSWNSVFAPRVPILIIHNRTNNVLHDVKLILSDAEITIGDMTPDQQIKFPREDLSVTLLATRSNDTKVVLKHGMVGHNNELSSYTVYVTPTSGGSTYEYPLSTRLMDRWHVYWRRLAMPKPPVTATTTSP